MLSEVPNLIGRTYILIPPNLIGEMYGWESQKEVDVIACMVGAIEHCEAEFPAVPVELYSNGVVVLSPTDITNGGWLEGGHNRALAHYLAEESLLCKVSWYHPFPIDPKSVGGLIKIKDICITDNVTNHELKLSEDPRYYKTYMELQLHGLL